MLEKNLCFCHLRTMTAGIHTAYNILLPFIHNLGVVAHSKAIFHYILQFWQSYVYYNPGQLIFTFWVGAEPMTHASVHAHSLSLWQTHTNNIDTTIFYLTLNQRPVLCNPVCWSSSICCPPDIEWWIYNIILCWWFVLSLQDNNLSMLLHCTLFTCIMHMYHNQRPAVYKICKYILESNFTHYTCRIWRKACVRENSDFPM